MPKALPKAPVGRLIVAAGAKRVSQAAIDFFTEYLEERAMKIARSALDLARHSGRKTIHADDVKLAAKH